MNIDINGLNSNRPDTPKRSEGGKAASENTAAPTPSVRTPNSDSVSLSSAASALSNLESDIKSFPDIDQARVNEIKARVESGNYQVNSQNLAQRMLDSEL